MSGRQVDCAVVVLLPVDVDVVDERCEVILISGVVSVME